MASSSSFSSPTLATSSPSTCISQVFLSFRGEDTRNTFVSHLYDALQRQIILTYMDDKKLPRGEYISPALCSAIEGSQIALVIFSKNYADSSWCLNELEYIMKCRVTRGLIVMPVFYHVDASDVRNQKGEFGEGFDIQLWKNNINKVVSWIRALRDESNTSGWVVNKTENRNESEIINNIVDTVSVRLFSLNPWVDQNLVGMTTRVKELEKRLDIKSDGVRTVGVWGLGGSGKTTLASSLDKKYKNSNHFQCQCFIENVREKSSKHGLMELQKTLLLTLLKTKVKPQNVDEGKEMISTRLKYSKVLIILDDVGDHEQLEALVGSHDWFGSGSRIIITTRDKHMLGKVNDVFRVTLLSPKEAVLLFKNHAYNKDNPLNDYVTLSSRVISYAAGLPLALKVLGSFLYDQNEKEWLSSLSRLENIPETKIVEILKISYDGLKTVEKELFLDIACFFRGSKAKEDDFQDGVFDDAMEVFEACGYYPDIGIKVLQQKALITIVNGKFDMHDLVQELGHYIVRGEHPKSPERHSRVWKKEEIRNMYLKDATTDNDKIEAMRYEPFDLPNGHLSLFSKIVSNMKNLRYLTFSLLYLYFDKYDQNFEGPNFLSNELRYINWCNYSASPFPDNFQPMKLVILKLNGSLQNQLCRDYKHLPLLRVLVLQDMKKLLSTPNFDGLPSLQKLILNNCEELKEIHPSLGKHTSLEYVEVHGCRELRMFPTIVHMGKLKTLRIIECHASMEFPVIRSSMESLVELDLNEMGIDALLPSIGYHCPNLTLLSLVCCSKTKEVNFAILGSLQKLNLSGNDFTRLDFSLSQLTRLKVLNLSGCKRLVELPKLPSGLVVFDAQGCDSLTTLRDFYTDCKWLSIVTLGEGGVITDGSRLLQTMIEENALQNHSMLLLVQGLEIAKEFRPRLRGRDRVRLELPENWSKDYSGFLMCVVGVIKKVNMFQLIAMKEVVSGMDSEDDVAEWEESNHDTATVVLYVPFSPLRNTTWWNSSTHKELFFTLSTIYNDFISGWGVKLVARKSGSDQLETLTQEESENSNYAPDVIIKKDSRSSLTMGLLNH